MLKDMFKRKELICVSCQKKIQYEFDAVCQKEPSDILSYGIPDTYNITYESNKEHAYMQRKKSFDLTLDDFFTILCDHFQKERDEDRNYQESEDCYAELVSDKWFLEDGTIYSGEVA